MDKLIDLYNRYSNFTHYRAERLSSIEDDNEAIKLKIQELELEKKQAQLEFDKKIHELKSQSNTTRARTKANEELSQEKRDLKDDLHNEIAKQYERGMTPRAIASGLGLSSTTLVYQAINSSSVPESQEEVPDILWHYFDNVSVHRYAVSDDRQYIKVHGTGDKFKVITVDDLRYVSGDKEIKVNTKRIITALEMFDGELEEGDYIARENPYSQ